MNLDAIRNFIREHLGLNAGAYGNDLWRELLAKRISSVGARSPDDYLARLRDDETELHALTSLITINETYFYRESQHLRLLTERLCPELLAHRSDDTPVRILSVGCSTGEEPYSILIALRERYGELADRFFEIQAGDVDRVALERARAGVYGRFSFRTLSPKLQERYFSPVDANHLQIEETLRQQVRFQPLNLLAADYPPALAGQDVIFFRNVSIYFDAPTRQHVLERLRTLLVPGGYLFVGISETLANDFGILVLRERDGVFLFTNEPPEARPTTVGQPRPGIARACPEQALERPPLSPAAPPRSRHAPPGAIAPGPLSLDIAAVPARSNRPPPLERPPPAAPRLPPVATIAAPAPVQPPPRAALDDQAVATLHDEALALARSERHQEALERLEPLCARLQPRAEDLVLKAYLLFEQARMAAAIALAQRVLEHDPWSLDALLLLGRGAQRQGRTADAIDFLRRAIYHQPDVWPAHFQLAEVYHDSGQAELARREYRIVLRQLERDSQSIDPRTILIGAPVLALADLRQLCQIRLTRLATSG